MPGKLIQNRIQNGPNNPSTTARKGIPLGSLWVALASLGIPFGFSLGSIGFPLGSLEFSLGSLKLHLGSLWSHSDTTSVPFGPLGGHNGLYTYLFYMDFERTRGVPYVRRRPRG